MLTSSQVSPSRGLRVVAYEADEARVSLALQREQQDELRLVQRSVQLPVHLRATRLDVRDVEEMLVRAAGESDAERLARGRVRAVAARKVRGLESLLGSVGVTKTRHDTGAGVFESQELDGALDFHALAFKPLDQDALVLVLRENQRIREGAQAGAHGAEHGARDTAAGDPQIHGVDLDAALDDGRRRDRSAGRTPACGLARRARARWCRAPPPCR